MARNYAFKRDLLHLFENIKCVTNLIEFTKHHIIDIGGSSAELKLGRSSREADQRLNNLIYCEEVKWGSITFLSDKYQALLEIKQ